MANLISIHTTVDAPVERVWECWTAPGHITQWNFASDDWHCPHAVNNIKTGGSFSWRMESRDGSMGFDFSGTYEKVIPEEHIVATLDDGRMLDIRFIQEASSTRVEEQFEPETMNSEDLQRQGWQAILDNFRKYTESGS